MFDNPVYLAGAVLILTLIGVIVTLLIVRPKAPTPEARRLTDADLQVVQSAESQAAEILEKARADATRIAADANIKAAELALRRKEEAARELEAAKGEARAQERRAQVREDAANERAKELASKEKQLTQVKKKLAERKEQLASKEEAAERTLAEQATVLYRISGLTREEAAKELFTRLDQELAAETAARIRRHHEQARADAEARSREVLLTAIQRYAAE